MNPSTMTISTRRTGDETLHPDCDPLWFVNVPRITVGAYQTTGFVTHSEITLGFAEPAPTASKPGKTAKRYGPQKHGVKY